MPLIRINEDGTVRIARKSGRDPIDVKPEELGKYNPDLIEDYNKIKTQQEIFSAGGETEFKKQQEKKSSAEQKRVGAFQATTGLVGELEKAFTEAKGGEYTGLGAIIGGTKKNIAGALNLDTKARVYNRIREGFTAALKELTGDVGVLTDKDYERIANLLPKFTDDPAVAKDLLNVLRSQLSAKFGGEKTTTQYVQPEVKGGAIAATVPGLTEAYKNQQELLKKYQGKEIGGLEYFLKRSPPGILAGPGGLEATGEVLGGASILSGLKNLFSGGIKNLSPLARTGEKRVLEGALAEAEGKIIENKSFLGKIIEKIEFSKKLGTGDKAKAVQMAKDNFNAGQTSIQESISHFMEADAFTRGGTKVRGAKGLYNLAVRDSLKEFWQKEAPGVLKETQNLSKLFSIGRGIKKTALYGGLAASGMGGISYLYNLLRGKGGK